MRKNSNVQSVCTDSTYVTGTGTRAYRNFFMQGYVTSYLVGTGNYSDRKHYTCQFEKTYSRTVSESRIKIFRIRIQEFDNSDPDPTYCRPGSGPNPSYYFGFGSGKLIHIDSASTLLLVWLINFLSFLFVLQ